MSLKFWTKVRDYAEKRMKEYHAHTRRCPNCKRWTHEVGGCVSIEQLDEWHESMECKQCGYKSRWFTGSMVAMLSDPLGTGGTTLGRPNEQTG